MKYYYRFMSWWIEWRFQRKFGISMGEAMMEYGRNVLLTPYPPLICDECAQCRGHTKKTVSKCSQDKCGWCDEIKPVSDSKDYGNPPFSNIKCDIKEENIS